jgi:hypothetical protein
MARLLFHLKRGYGIAHSARFLRFIEAAWRNAHAMTAEFHALPLEAGAGDV